MCRASPTRSSLTRCTSYREVIYSEIHYTQHTDNAWVDPLHNTNQLGAFDEARRTALLTRINCPEAIQHGAHNKRSRTLLLPIYKVQSYWYNIEDNRTYHAVP